MKRTPAQIERSLRALATDLEASGLRRYAQRLRRYATEQGTTEIPKNKTGKKSVFRREPKRSFIDELLG